MFCRGGGRLLGLGGGLIGFGGCGGGGGSFKRRLIKQTGFWSLIENWNRFQFVL